MRLDTITYDGRTDYEIQAVRLDAELADYTGLTVKTIRAMREDDEPSMRAEYRALIEEHVDTRLAAFSGLTVEAVQEMRERNPRAHQALLERYDDYIRRAPAIEEPSIWQMLGSDIKKSRGLVLLKAIGFALLLWIIWCVVVTALQEITTTVGP